jgi:hypothetical protein
MTTEEFEAFYESKSHLTAVQRAEAFDRPQPSRSPANRT